MTGAAEQALTDENPWWHAEVAGAAEQVITVENPWWHTEAAGAAEQVLTIENPWWHAEAAGAAAVGHVVGGGGQLLPALLLIARPHLPHLGRTFKVNTTQPAFALAAVDDNIL